MSEQMFRFGQRSLSLNQPQVMGILNVTPDSFSDGGQLLAAERLDQNALLRRVEAMLQAGATLLDIGGESTRPGAAPVGVQQELDRVIPAMELIGREFEVVLSVDTSTPQVMTEAAKVGCGLINDVRALQRDGALEAAAATGLPVCLMHMLGQPGTMQQAPNYRDVTAEVIEFLEQRMVACKQAGIAADQLIVDPGFGFGKTLEHNLLLLKQLERFKSLSVPLLAGISRKSMIGALLNKTVDQRLYGSLAAAVLAVSNGAWIVRVHDVEATKDAITICQAVSQAG